MARKKSKDGVSKKTDQSFEDEEDSGLVTKKFWSYARATAKSTRKPELVQLVISFKSNPVDQAHLFNFHFYNQFSESSMYDIDIDNSNSRLFEIYFNSSRVFSILKSIIPSKAKRPDKIHGIVLKNCSKKLSKPLSLLFTKSYYSGSIPEDLCIKRVQKRISKIIGLCHLPA